ncbi:hypothetical protein OC842_003617 [Tilletia horrida]|uniref:Uncharacterized protein n=1 Tax=Tilletia horrida TaxID=155126 RepID=A0AAN6JL09_9BASI|nr:hypothetical protein OC842_003617 [Tilletia horrida]
MCTVQRIGRASPQAQKARTLAAGNNGHVKAKNNSSLREATRILSSSAGGRLTSAAPAVCQVHSLQALTSAVGALCFQGFKFNMSIKWPPDHFEWVPGQPGKRVRCTICADSAKSTTGFNRSTAAAHINTARHKKAEDIVKHLHNVCLPSSSDVEDEFRAEDRSHLSSPIPLYQPMHLFIDDDADMQDAQQELDERARSSSPALTEEDLPDRMDSDASEAWWSEDDDESINDAELLEDLPSLQTLADGDFHPFPSRVIFLLHAVASNPRNPLSVTQIRLILQLLKWLGFSDAPSYDKYRKGVQEATSMLSNGAERITEVQGCEEHDFCTTSIATELARDFVNPEARKNMTLYPRADPNIVDLLDGDWAHSLRDSRAAPMVRLPDGRDAFREEPVQLIGGRILLVVAWFQRGGQTHGWGLRCQRDGSAQHILNVVSDREEEFATSAIELVGNSINSINKQVTKLADKEDKTFNERDVTNLAAQFFYASAVADYSKGEGADMLEKAVMLYLQQHPETLGTSGKEIMKATNTDVQKQIKTILRDKWTNLRYKLKTEIHSSTGEEDGKTPLNACELLDKLVKSYPVVKTERLLERIAVIRYCILEYHVRLPPPDRMNADENDDDAQDSAGKWSMNDNFWTQAGEFISDCVKMYADPARRDEVCKLYEDIVAADKERFGDWTFKDRTADRKTEVTINKFIKAAYPENFRAKKGGRQQEGEAQNGHERNGRKQDANGGPRDNKRERNGRQQDDEDRLNSEDADGDEDFDEDEDKELPHVKIDTDDEDLYN